MKANHRLARVSVLLILSVCLFNNTVRSQKDTVEINRIITEAREAISIAGENPDSCKLIAMRLLHDPLVDNSVVKGYVNEALGEAYYYLQNFDSARVAYTRALEAFVAVGDKTNQATLYNNIGLINYFRGKYDVALENYNASLQIEIELDNEMGMARSYHNVGMVFGRWERYDQQFKYYNKALAIYEKFGDQESIAGLTNNMGITYATLQDYEKALDNYRKAYFAYKELGNKQRMASISTNLGCLFVYLQENLRAIEYLNEAIAYFKSSHDKMGLIATYSSTGDAYRAVGNYGEAIRYYRLMEKENKELNLLARRKDNYRSLYEVYKEMGEFEKALHMHEMYTSLSDSIFTSHKYERLVELEKKYHSEKSEKELIELKAKDQKRELLLWGLVILLVFMSVLAVIRVYVIKMKERQRRLIMEHKVLRTQMNPHFIFNALSALQCFIIEENQEESLDFIADFSSLMRLVLQYAKEESISLQKEKEILERYISLQNRRFENKISFEMDFDEQMMVEKVMVPPMLVQPFVENAIEHACLDKKGDGFIRLMYMRDRDKLAVTIEDNGIGIKQSQQRRKLINHKSMAMELTSERIRLLQEKRGKKFEGMEVEDLSDYELSGTRITFWIPYMEMN